MLALEEEGTVVTGAAMGQGNLLKTIRMQAVTHVLPSM